MRASVGSCAGAVVVGLVLSACSASEEVPTVPEFQFKSGTLAIGEFSSSSVEGNLFDPCTEISPEEYEAAGIPDVRPVPADQQLPGYNSCDTGLYEDKVGQRLVISGGSRSEAGYKTSSDNHLEYPESVVPGLYTITSDLSGVCIAQVDTERGGLKVQMSAQGLGSEDVDSCQVARETIENLYKAVNTDEEEQ